MRKEKENIYSRPVRGTLHLSLLCCLPGPLPGQPLSYVFHFIVVCLPIPVLTVSRKLRVLTWPRPLPWPLCAWPSICYAHFWLSLRCFCEVDTAFQQVKGPRAVQRIAAALNASSRMQLKDIHKRYISCSVGWVYSYGGARFMFPAAICSPIVWHLHKYLFGPNKFAFHMRWLTKQKRSDRTRKSECSQLQFPHVSVLFKDSDFPLFKQRNQNLKRNLHSFCSFC